MLVNDQGCTCMSRAMSNILSDRNHMNENNTTTSSSSLCCIIVHIIIIVIFFFFFSSTLSGVLFLFFFSLFIYYCLYLFHIIDIINQFVTWIEIKSNRRSSHKFLVAVVIPSPCLPPSLPPSPLLIVCVGEAEAELEVEAGREHLLPITIGWQIDANNTVVAVVVDTERKRECL